MSTVLSNAEVVHLIRDKGKYLSPLFKNNK